MENEQKAAFPATVWTVIRFAKDRECDDYCKAMNDLITRYWRPIFYFLRVRGYPIHQAEDLTQEFFLNLLERRWITKADPARRKFRTFLLTILVRFVELLRAEVSDQVESEVDVNEELRDLEELLQD